MVFITYPNVDFLDQLSSNQLRDKSLLQKCNVLEALGLYLSAMLRPPFSYT
jgi:hypothetical protein